MTVKNASQLVLLIENNLGFVLEPQPNKPKPIPILRRIEAAKINRKIRSNPDLYTWHNLELAVAYLYMKHRLVRSPLAVFDVVKEAVELAGPPEKDVLAP